MINRFLMLSAVSTFRATPAGAFTSLRKVSHPCRSCSSSVLQRTTVSGRIQSVGSPDIEGKALEKELSAKTRRHLERTARREKRIRELEAREYDLSTAETAKLNGLREESFQFEEKYDVSTFNESHREFKESHNQVFVALTKYCQREQGSAPIKVFFLDGPNAGTASALCESGSLSVQQCYTANRHSSTCDALRSWGIPSANVVHASAFDALSCNGAFADISFGAYYLDACGGFAPMITEMFTAALERSGKQDAQLQSPVAVGFTLVGGNRDVVDKELEVLRHLVVLAKVHGMRVHHVLEDPVRYGVDPKTRKVDGGTLTTWVVLEMEHR